MLVGWDWWNNGTKRCSEVLGGATVTDVALRYGVTRQTVHRWLRRYAGSGLAGLVDHSSRPATCPHQMPPEVEARIARAAAGSSRLGPAHPSPPARPGGRRASSRPLLHLSLSRPPRPHRPPEAAPAAGGLSRWERSRSMELWQMDVMGGVKLEDGSELKIVTGLDDHSRFCVSALLVPRATARPVCEALALALRRYGVPDQILTDNGKVFTSRFGPGKGEVLFDRICRENGIRHLLTAPALPHHHRQGGALPQDHAQRSSWPAGSSPRSRRPKPSSTPGWPAITRSGPTRASAWSPRRALRSCRPEACWRRSLSEPEEEQEVPDAGSRAVRRLTRRVSEQRPHQSGHASPITWARFLAGETVEVEIGRSASCSIFHRGVLVATHARRHPTESKSRSAWRAATARPRPKTGQAVGSHRSSARWIPRAT